MFHELTLSYFFGGDTAAHCKSKVVRKEKEREEEKGLALFVFAKPMSNIGMNHYFVERIENNLALPKQGFPAIQSAWLCYF